MRRMIPPIYQQDIVKIGQWGGKLWDSLPDDSNSVRYLLQEQTEQNA
jgi:hypothetical protein